jgi:hypothetical protein
MGEVGRPITAVYNPSTTSLSVKHMCAMRVIDEAVKNDLTALENPETIHDIVLQVEQEFYEKEWQKPKNKQKLKKFHTEWYKTMMENHGKTKRKENQEEDDEEANEPRTDDEQEVPPPVGSPLLPSSEPDMSPEASPSDMLSPEGRDAKNSKRSPEKEEKNSVKRGLVEVEKVTYKGDVRDIDYLLKRQKK